MGYTWTGPEAPAPHELRRWLRALRDRFRPPHLSERMLELVDCYHLKRN